jgi:hypothetical protein
MNLNVSSTIDVDFDVALSAGRWKGEHPLGRDHTSTLIDDDRSALTT